MSQALEATNKAEIQKEKMEAPVGKLHSQALDELKKSGSNGKNEAYDKEGQTGKHFPAAFVDANGNITMGGPKTGAEAPKELATSKQSDSKQADNKQLDTKHHN